jgi:hypothetical protein
MVFQAWRCHRETPTVILSSEEAEYLADEDTVGMVLTGDDIGLELRGEVDNGYAFSDASFREYCSARLLPPNFRIQLQKSFNFLFLSASPIIFKN